MAECCTKPSTFGIIVATNKITVATGYRLGGFLQSMGNLGVGLIIAFAAGWKLTFVMLGILPFIALGGMMTVRVLAGGAGKNKAALEESGRIAVESFENMRTIASLTKEEIFQRAYLARLEPALKSTLRSAHALGFSYSVGQSATFFSYAIAFYYAGVLIEDREMDIRETFRVFFCIMFGAMAAGHASAFAPDVGNAKTAAQRLMKMIDSTAGNEVLYEMGARPAANTFRNAIYFSDVHFNYPNRKSFKVLQGLTFSVEPGQTVALVGSSGCGKSTSVSMVERFYEPTQGTVNLDRFNLNELNRQWLRYQMGLVSQEPVLFDCTVAENIAYGDNFRKVGMDEIIEAAKKANVHNFIEALPLAYETNVGNRGTQLSGGQKQRIAIARALLRNPKILLLDEATSALDTESEKIVQEAIDKAKEGRTCITIAHRLSTIINADKIIVIDKGVVVEQGTHHELMVKKGFYYKLHKIQGQKR